MGEYTIIRYNLKSVSNAIQQVAEATAAVLNLGVTVVDANFERIAGTGYYKESIGCFTSRDSAFAVALETGKTILVKNATKDSYCRSCSQKIKCKERAHICTPIKIEDQVVGIIGVIAWNAYEKALLLEGADRYIKFLQKMADLISHKISEQQVYEKLQNTMQQLEEIVNTVNDGIISIDKSGKILTYNTAAKRLLGIKKESDSLPHNLPLWDTLKNGKNIYNKEVTIKKESQSCRFYLSCMPVFRDKNIIGAVGVIRDYKDVKNMLNHFNSNHPKYTFSDIIGNSNAIEKALEIAIKAARTDSNILLIGESGTGKELFAHSICSASKRSLKPFITVNCAAIPDNMLESELFGYEEGAFTGAKKGGKPGRFELAHEGTLFLDEISELPLRLQVKLLRAIQSGTISRLGSTGDINVNVRIIATTNRDLEEMVRKKEFREDLYYRINVIPINIPPLRERKDDIPLLIDHFIKKYNFELKKEVEKVDKNVLSLFYNYDWPGNVRELQNAIEFAMNMTSGIVISLDDLPLRLHKKIEGKQDSLKKLQQIEKEMLKKGLEIYGNSEDAKNKIAKELGISRSSVYRKLKKYNLI